MWVVRSMHFKEHSLSDVTTLLLKMPPVIRLNPEFGPNANYGAKISIKRHVPGMIKCPKYVLSFKHHESWWINMMINESISWTQGNIFGQVMVTWLLSLYVSPSTSSASFFIVNHTFRSREENVPYVQCGYAVVMLGGAVLTDPTLNSFSAFFCLAFCRQTPTKINANSKLFKENEIMMKTSPCSLQCIHIYLICTNQKHKMA